MKRLSCTAFLWIQIEWKGRKYDWWGMRYMKNIHLWSYCQLNHCLFLCMLSKENKMKEWIWVLLMGECKKIFNKYSHADLLWIRLENQRAWVFLSFLDTISSNSGAKSGGLLIWYHHYLNMLQEKCYLRFKNPLSKVLLD